MEMIHQAVLNLLMSRKVMTSAELEASLVSFAEEDEDPPELAEVIETINTSLREVELKLDSTASAGSKSWAVVDASSNATQELGDDSVWSLTNPGPSSQHATTYTRPQLEMYNKIVEAAIESESGSVSEIECVNFRNDTKGKKMTGPEAEVFLSQLCQAGWLQRGTGQRARGRRRMDIAALTDGGGSDGDGGGEDTAFDGVRLGVRSMIDLRTFLSNAVTVPEPPSIERVEVEGGLGEGVAHVHFSAGSSEGGAPVTGFVVTVSGGSGGKLTVSGKQSPITVSNLGQGRYTFTVKALNLGGTSDASAPSDRCDVKGVADPQDAAATGRGRKRGGGQRSTGAAESSGRAKRRR